MRGLADWSGGVAASAGGGAATAAPHMQAPHMHMPQRLAFQEVQVQTTELPSGRGELAGSIEWAVPRLGKALAVFRLALQGAKHLPALSARPPAPPPAPLPLPRRPASASASIP